MKVTSPAVCLGLVAVLCCTAVNGQWPLTAIVRDLLSGMFNSSNPDPRAYMSTPQLIQNASYPVETHKVTTEDGYILTMFRIPTGKNGTASTKGPVVVQHGLLCSSNDWLLVPASDALPYLLVDAGYDVWLGNCRGNNYSLEHTNLTQDDPAFWDFSFHEMGKYDVPAVINYVLNNTGAVQLSWVGHSMGTTMFFIANDLNQTISSQVKSFVALAPAIYIEHAKTPLAALALSPSSLLTGLFNLTSGGRIIPADVNKYLKLYGPKICLGVPAVLCENVIFLIAGYDFQQTTNETASMITGHTPSDASAKTLAHYLQYVGKPNASFAQYDYGAEQNQVRYGTANPPVYDLSKTTCPTFTRYGFNDWLAGPNDTERAIKEFGNSVNASLVNFSRWNHLDFTYGKDVKTLVYNDVLAWLKSRE